MKNKNLTLFISLLLLISCSPKDNLPPESLSGIYPRLAYYNSEGECGTGAVVPWADRLWVITYGPHLPKGSSDKLYEITPDLQQIVREESVGGTPANRMIHQESNQLFIGPYAIDSSRQVRVIPYSEMPGRHTGNARHLTDPEHKIYYGTMEEGFYEVDVNSLEVKELYRDGNVQENNQKPGSYAPISALLPGVHGKGLYSGQGVMVFSNNGEGSSEALTNPDIEAGVLAEWNGKKWKVIRRNQFTEITGPGGIYGNTYPETDPIWATGWDSKSIILGVREIEDGWKFYRLPKASHSYDGAHGWNTEWPRIRDIGTHNQPEYLMTMHGMFWKFPETFTTGYTAGIRPRSAYLKVIGDFARWKDRLVFGCDDAAQKEFLNKRKAKGNIEGPGQSNSNLWFTSLSKPDELGPATASGSVWENDQVAAGSYSDPFLFTGWDYRSCWIKNNGKETTTFTFEMDEKGNNHWKEVKKETVPAGRSLLTTFSSLEKGEWVRVKVDQSTIATVCFNYTTKDNRTNDDNNLFKGLASVEAVKSTGGLLYGLGNNQRTLGIVSQQHKDGNITINGYYELTDSLQLVHKDAPKTTLFILEKFAIPEQAISIEESSVLVVDDKGRRWRLPLGNKEYSSKKKQGTFRICREVATERDLFNCHGTFYELPAENADGYAKIRPICSHSFGINDYASYRGLLVMTGVDLNKSKGNKHIIISKDKKAAVWAGCIDDLWEMGKPIGQGGPWLNTDVKAQIASDPYLIGFYDKKTLTLSHKGTQTVTFSVEIDPTGNNNFMKYHEFRVEPGKTFTFQFPEGFHGRWIRFRTDINVNATAWLEYQ
ncbi:MAG: hypothetical protein ACK5LF_17140 [Bacteroides xylanisolvens]